MTEIKIRARLSAYTKGPDLYKLEDNLQEEIEEAKRAAEDAEGSVISSVHVNEDGNLITIQNNGTVTDAGSVRIPVDEELSLDSENVVQNKVITRRIIDDEEALEAEAAARLEADSNLQQEIDAISASSDVVDVLGTYQELQRYETSKLGDNDIVKVLSDETHDGAMTYYRWKIVQHAWVYIGEQGPYYTKAQVDEDFLKKEDTSWEQGQGDNSAKLKGSETEASGKSSVAEGFNTTASGDYSHAEGLQNEASGIASHAEGRNNLASGDFQTVVGSYNEVDEDAAFIVGNGSPEPLSRSNAFKVMKQGATIAGRNNSAIEDGDLFVVGDGESSSDTHSALTVNSKGTRISSINTDIDTGSTEKSVNQVSVNGDGISLETDAGKAINITSTGVLQLANEGGSFIKLETGGMEAQAVGNSIRLSSDVDGEGPAAVVNVDYNGGISAEYGYKYTDDNGSGMDAYTSFKMDESEISLSTAGDVDLVAGDGGISLGAYGGEVDISSPEGINLDTGGGISLGSVAKVDIKGDGGISLESPSGISLGAVTHEGQPVGPVSITSGTTCNITSSDDISLDAGGGISIGANNSPVYIGSGDGISLSTGGSLSLDAVDLVDVTGSGIRLNTSGIISLDAGQVNIESSSAVSIGSSTGIGLGTGGNIELIGQSVSIDILSEDGTVTINNVVDPTTETMAANKRYVDNAIDDCNTISKSYERRITNLEYAAKGYLYRDEVDNTVAYKKSPPADAMPYASIDMIGGRTIVDENKLVSAKVNQVTSAKSTFSFNSRIYLPTTDGGNSFSIIRDGVEYNSLNYEALLYGCMIYFDTPSGEEPLMVDLENVETRFDEESQMDVFVSGDLPSNFDNNFIVKNLDDSSVLGGWFGENGTFNVSPIGIYTVPEAVRNLPMYGASAGSVYNEVDFVNKKYIQRVGAITFDGTENWVMGGILPDLSDRYYSSPKIEGAVNDNGSIVKVVAPLTEVATTISNGQTTVGYGMTWGNFRYRPQNIQTINEWKAILQVLHLTVYYALENPIITDISDLLTEDNFIQVDEDGSITFEQEDDTEIAVPNTETFLIKLGGADHA